MDVKKTKVISREELLSLSQSGVGDVVYHDGGIDLITPDIDYTCAVDLPECPPVSPETAQQIPDWELRMNSGI